jgi:hypothetical protein
VSDQTTDIITIKGVLGLDGEYELDWSTLNGLELRTIKRVSGVRANELDSALVAGDWDVQVAVTMIALKRSGKDHAESREVEMALLLAPLTAIQQRPKDPDASDPPASLPE